jgi:hydrogenase maturation protease
MGDLAKELRERLRGRVCLVGIGNPDLGDDGFGVRLAEVMRAAGHPDVVVAGTTPERWAARLAEEGFDTVVLLDAVSVAAEPGAVVFWPAGDLATRFPQISTHKLSLGTLARLMEAAGRVWLLGAQPERLLPGSGLSAPVRTTLEALTTLLCDALSARAAQPAPAWEQP